MPTKFCNFPAKTQASARTVRWPWFWLGLWLGLLVELLRLIIGRLFNVAPIPTTQNAIPTRKPLRVFSFWKLELTAPRHFRRAIAQILMQPNVVVEKREFTDGLFKSRFAADFNQSNCAFKGAKKALDTAIHPRRMRRAPRRDRDERRTAIFRQNLVKI